MATRSGNVPPNRSTKLTVVSTAPPLIGLGEAIRVPTDLDYDSVGGLSLEMRERLHAARPETLAAASRIAGITPAALAAILVHLRRRQAA